MRSIRRGVNSVTHALFSPVTLSNVPVLVPDADYAMAVPFPGSSTTRQIAHATVQCSVK